MEAGFAKSFEAAQKIIKEHDLSLKSVTLNSKS